MNKYDKFATVCGLVFTGATVIDLVAYISAHRRLDVLDAKLDFFYDSSKYY